METSSLKRIVNKYTETSLIIRILIGMAIGVVLALTVPQFTGIKILGDLFVGALKAIAPLLVCLLIMSSLAQTKEGHNGNMKTVVILYMFSTIMGAIVAVAGSFLFPLKITLADAVQQEAPKGVVEVLENLLLKIVIHFFKSVNSIIFLFSRMIRFNHRAKSTESISPLPTQNILKHLFYRFKS